ncbi:MAG: tetratricopeptide repeat protein, partial [Deltaproteobacteria bacterium]
MHHLIRKSCHKTVINQVFLLLAILLVVEFHQVIFPATLQASVPNQLYRVEIRPKKEYTHITVNFQDKPSYNLLSLPGNKLRLVIHETNGPLFRKFKRYSDRNIGGLVFSRRGSDMMITFRIAAGTGWRDPVLDGVNSITLDVGKQFNPGKPHPFVLGREKIWSGVEKLVRDFDPPLKTEIPFIPTDRQILKSILDEDDQKLFTAAESALYKGHFSDVEGVFTQFATRQSPIKPLALYRLGETLYKLQKYPQALAAFREGERVWPAFLDYNPGVAFYYGDSIARSGDLTGGRALMARLIDRLADKGYASPLLVRMADVLVRQGRDMEALAIYRTVADNFKENKSHQMAQLRLADREFMTATPWSYKGLIEKYQDISTNASDITIREESNFKEALLAAIHGGAPAALKNVLNLQKIFPRGVYASICRTIREVLVSQVYRETDWSKNEAGLVRFVEEHQDYLAGCLEQPGFLENITRAYEEAGRPIELIKIFSTLLERQWALAGAPYMLEQIADRADIL